MVIDKETPKGAIRVSLDLVSSIVASSVLECYGVVGLTAQNNNLGDRILIVLDKERFSKAIKVKKNDQGYEVSVFLVLAMHVKINEVLAEVQRKVTYDLNKAFGNSLFTVNIYVQGLKEVGETE